MSLEAALEAQLPVTMALLAVISAVGGAGNLVVMLIYSRRCDKQATNLFMTVLAAADTFTCTFIIPSTIVMEYCGFTTTSLLFCKSYIFFNNCAIPFSALLISLIAVDRYFCICHPFSQVMSLHRSRLFIGVVLLLSILLGTLASFQVHIQLQYQNKTGQYVSVCAEANNWINQTLSQKLFYQVTQKSQLVSYSLCILIVICLYSAIYYTVLKVRRKKDRLKGLHSAKSRQFQITLSQVPQLSPMQRPYACEMSTCGPGGDDMAGTGGQFPLTVVTDNTAVNYNQLSPLSAGLNKHKNQFSSCSPSPSYSSLNSAPNNNTSNTLQSPGPLLTITATTTNRINDPSPVPGTNPQRKLKSLRDTKVVQNLKLAVMLFVVAITYIVTFLPANLMANKAIKLYLPVFYLYYMNNAANPIIYCFMNRNFRNELKSLRFLRSFVRRQRPSK